MTIAQTHINTLMENYAANADTAPLFILGDALAVLRQLPAATFDCCITSPPYWGQRQYNNGGIGMEEDYRDYITHLLAVFAEVKRVLKPEGSFWLNIGDAYYNKHLLGLPWRIALALTDKQGWILRNSVIWHKVKGGLDNTDDRLRNVHENVFHFVQNVWGCRPTPKSNFKRSHAF